MTVIDIESAAREIASCDGMRIRGRIQSIGQTFDCNLPCSIGDQCQIIDANDQPIQAEVVRLAPGIAKLMPYDSAANIRVGCPVERTSRRPPIPIGNAVLGRVLDGLGRPIDGGTPIPTNQFASSSTVAPKPLDRARVNTRFETGIKVIDGMFTCGRGQRVGIFSGSGVGKSTLLGQIARESQAEINVIALVGERGCELRPFLEDCLGEEGLKRSVVVMATCDAPPMMRRQAVDTAIAIADAFRKKGKDVLFLLDSLTRLAMAQRELGLLNGEPPTSRGYTPSAFQMMAEVLERLGNSAHGSITGFVTVLVEGDDLDEPISDAARAMLDGHLVLSRKLAEREHFPSVDLGQSISRAFMEVTDRPHRDSVRKLKAIQTTYSDVEDLIRVGAYAKGSNPEVEMTLKLMPELEKFLQQPITERVPFERTRSEMDKIAKQWTE